MRNCCEAGTDSIKFAPLAVEASHAVCRIVRLVEPVTCWADLMTPQAVCAFLSVESHSEKTELVAKSEYCAERTDCAAETSAGKYNEQNKRDKNR